MQRRYAIVFPDMQRLVENSSSENLFNNTCKEIMESFSAGKKLTNLILQNKRTREIEKRINVDISAEKEVIKNLEVQANVQYEEQSIRFDAALNELRKEVEIELKEFHKNVATRIQNNNLVFAEEIEKNNTLQKIFSKEKDFLLGFYKDYLDACPKEFKIKKEYIAACEMQRQTLDSLTVLLQKMI